ncbi:MAG: exonuclease SbcCD subunit D [Anaerolineae bacterium]|nr:exonuclease SbcCD subunit D [Anaerolineae bacterium]
MSVIKLLHFADAHIDMAGHGRHDPETGLPYRVIDFLKALDHIVNAAINEKVDLVIFAGDAYKDRTPVPTFQREWGRRILRLSRAGIPTLLLVGNHDLSPAIGRAHALQEFETLEIPHIKVISRPMVLGPDDLEGLPLQIIALPWVTRSGLMANMEPTTENSKNINAKLEELVTELILNKINEADPNLPLILAAHTSVQGARYGSERTVMLGNDMLLSTGLVTNPRLDYVALGHIHKAQNLNEGHHPPVIYPGSIERVDFGEVDDDKYFVLAELSRGSCEVKFCKLDGRRFFDRRVELNPDELNPFSRMAEALPPPADMKDAIVRLTVSYPRQMEPLIDEPAIRRYAETSFEFHLLRKPQLQARVRLPEDQTISSMPAQDLLQVYWKTINKDVDFPTELEQLASEIINPPDETD